MPKHQPPYLKKKNANRPDHRSWSKTKDASGRGNGWEFGWGERHFWVVATQTFLIFIPTWGNDPIWRAYFSDGLVQPPTSFFFSFAFFWCHQIAACLLVMRVLRSYKDLKPRYFFLNAVKGISRNVRMVSGQIIATSQGLTPKGSWGREIPLFQANLGGWNSIIWPDMLQWQVFFLCGIRDPHDTTGNSLV